MFEQDEWGKKIFNKEEIDFDTCDLEKIREIKEKLQERVNELKEKIIR